MYTKRNQWLGIPVIVLGALTGSTTLMAGSQDMSLHFGLGLLMLLTSALTAVQNFLKFDVLAERHHQAANMYDTLATHIEVELATPHELRQDAHNYIENLQLQMGHLNNTVPQPPRRIYLQFSVQLDKVHKQNVNNARSSIEHSNGQRRRNSPTFIMQTNDQKVQTRQMINQLRAQERESVILRRHTSGTPSVGSNDSNGSNPPPITHGNIVFGTVPVIRTSPTPDESC